MKNIRFFALILVLSLVLSPLSAFSSDNGPHGDEGLLSSGQLRAVAMAGGKIMSQSNVLKGGMQVRFGQNGAAPNMDPIKATAVQLSGGGVNMGDLTGAVDTVLQNIGSYTMPGGTRIFSADMINNAVRFSGTNQLQQNAAVQSVANIMSVPAQAYQNFYYGGTSPSASNGVNAILGLKADPAGVASHMQMFADYANKNPKILASTITNKMIGYQVAAFLPNVNPVAVAPDGAVLTIQSSTAGVINNQSQEGVLTNGTGSKPGSVFSTNLSEKISSLIGGNTRLERIPH